MSKQIQIVGQDTRPVETLPKDYPCLVFVRNNKMYARYTNVDEGVQIETDVFDGAGEVLPSPTSDDNGRVLGVVEGAYALVEQSGGGDLPFYVTQSMPDNQQNDKTVNEFLAELGISAPQMWDKSYFGVYDKRTNMLYCCELGNYGALTLRYDYITRYGNTYRHIARLYSDTSTGVYTEAVSYFMPKGVPEIAVNDNDKYLHTNLSTGDLEWSALNGVPSLPDDASTKTYVLKAINGVLTWVEQA